MKKIVLLFVFAALTCSAADSLLKPINDLGYGTFKLRAQALSMYRDYENNTPGNAYSTTLGVQLGYESPELAGLSFGAVYSYVEPFDSSRYSNNGKTLLSNGRVDLLNEVWLTYRLESLGLTNTFIKAGRQVVNGEVFRSDEFRQKPRSLEAVVLTTKDIPNTVLTVGHAWRLSNWMDNEASWKFKDIEDVLLPAKGRYPTDGITWVEAVYTGITNLELAVYDAYAHDIANIAGLRAKYKLADTTTLNGYYRHESDVGCGVDHSSDMFGASVQQKIGSVTLEPGYFGIYGDGLLFQETTTGINHPLGALMLIYTGQFAGDSDTFYMKATTKVGKTALYALYSYTWNNSLSYDGQELNVVVKQPIGDRLTLALKVGAGYRDDRNGGADTVATDTRLFVTYNF